MREIEDYTAVDGTIRMANGDGGDAAMKTAMYFNGLYPFGQFGKELWPFENLARIDKAKHSLFLKPGVLVRCQNDGVEWHKNPKCTSGDQSVGWFYLFGLYLYYDDLWAFAWAHIKRFGFCQNWENEVGEWKVADWRGDVVLSSLIRGFRIFFLWPLLLFTDLFTLGSSVILCMTKNPDNVGDDQNHLQALFFAKTRYPTPVSWLARKWYFKFRKTNFGSYMPDADYGTDGDVIQAYNQAYVRNDLKNAIQSAPVGALWWYHRASQGAPPMWKIWTEKIKGDLSWH